MDRALAHYFLPINISWEWENCRLSPFKEPHKACFVNNPLLGLRMAHICWARRWSATQIPSSYSPSCSVTHSLPSHCHGLRRSPHDKHIRMALHVDVNGSPLGRLKNTGERTVRSRQVLQQPLT